MLAPGRKSCDNGAARRALSPLDIAAMLPFQWQLGQLKAKFKKKEMPAVLAELENMR